jgi:EAL domain-containing protein (putative c-di-GMP-specific phosphodiesterase class I)/ActR/RegA family two-component response regulator
MQPVALVVDDDAGLRKFGAAMSEEAGFRAESAATGAEALAAIETLHPAVVLLDLQMPDKDGIHVMQIMASAKSDAKLILLSGIDGRTLTVSTEIARQRGLSVVASLQKPVPAEKLRQILHRLSIEFSSFDVHRLRESLEGDLIRLHYQPKVTLSSRTIAGVEALLRCHDAGGNPVSPEAVIAVAEQSGAIDELTHKVFALAIAQRRAWSEQGVELDMAVNLCARGAIEADLSDRLADLCAANQVPPQALTIELTENTVTSDSLLAMETLVRLRLRGFALSIDDFGTGYSSLVRLQQLPFSELKIDKSFVITAQKSPQNEVIIRTLAQLANNLQMKCVIEGVEDEATLEFAASQGCNFAQGYFIAPALPPDEVPRFAKEWQVAH